MASKRLPCAMFKLFGYVNLGFEHWHAFELNVSFCTEVSVRPIHGDKSLIS